MKENKYYHILTTGEVRIISKDEYYKRLRQISNQLLVCLYDTGHTVEIYLRKGNNWIALRGKMLDSVLEILKGAKKHSER